MKNLLTTLAAISVVMGAVGAAQAFGDHKKPHAPTKHHAHHKTTAKKISRIAPKAPAK